MDFISTVYCNKVLSLYRNILYFISNNLGTKEMSHTHSLPMVVGTTTSTNEPTSSSLRPTMQLILITIHKA